MAQQSRRFCFTLNNYTAEEEMALQALRGIRYLVYGRERGDEGTPHLQGFIIFNSGRRFSALHRQFPRAHWEQTRGSSEQAADYCKKDGDVYEAGVLPQEKGEGERARWDEARIAAAQGRFDDIPSDIYIRYIGNLKKIYSDAQPMPEPIEVLDFHWYYGETGTGKSRTAREQNPGYYVKGINKWWDGYTDQNCVIIEEWGPMDPGAERAMAHYLKQWCDHHPFNAEFKGGSKMIRPKKIIITSNWSIDECFKDEQNREPLKRRLQQHHFHAFPPRPHTPALTPTVPCDSPSLFSLF